MKLMLTGGTGFFGKALLRHWLSMKIKGMQPPSVTVLSRSPENFLSKYPEFARQSWLVFHQADILDPSTFPSGTRFTHLLHGATDSTLGPYLTPLERYIQIVDGTRNLLDFAAKEKICRFLLASSGGVYGPQPYDLEFLPEGYTGMPDPLSAANAYSIGKRCAEHMCALYQERYGLATVIARCFAFVGRDLPLDVHFAIGNFIRDALIAEEITVNGDGAPIRSYMDQRDLASWLIALLERGKAGQAYNVGSDLAITIGDLAILVRNSLAPKKPIRICANRSVQTFRTRYVPSIEKARTEMKLGLSYTLIESIRETARHNYN